MQDLTARPAASGDQDAPASTSVPNNAVDSSATTAVAGSVVHLAVPRPAAVRRSAADVEDRRMWGYGNGPSLG